MHHVQVPIFDYYHRRYRLSSTATPLNSQSDASIRKKNKNNVINRSERIICVRYPHPFISGHFFLRENTPIYNTRIIVYILYFKCLRIRIFGGFAPTHGTTVSDAKKHDTPFKCRDETKTSISKLGGTILLLLYYFYYTMCCYRFGTRTLSCNPDPHKLSYDSFPALNMIMY